MYRPNKQAMALKMAEAGIDSYKDLAGLSGVSVNTISRLNNGGSAHLRTLESIAAALGCTAVDIIKVQAGQEAG